MALRTAFLSSVVASGTAVVPPVVLEDTSAVLAADSATCALEGHGGSFQHNGGALNDGVATFATYNFDPEESGCYLVEEYHPVMSGGCVQFAPQSIPIKINFCKNLTTMGYINQGVNGGSWNKLTTLPFYKGWPASIEITREGLNGQMTACDASGCFWMADAFRLTYVAPDCSDLAVREAMQQEDHNSVAGSTDEDVQLDSTGVSTVQTIISTTLQSSSQLMTENEEPTSKADEPRMVLEAHLTESTIDDQEAFFVFQPPVDGCYLIEEKHPPVHGLDSAALTVNYCKGMSAVGEINHTDGRHDRWNYVASLPFYAGHEGRISLPKHAVVTDAAQTRKRSHAFRLTHVGARCHVAEAATHHVTVRITADFATIVDRVTVFGQQLLQLIADATGSLGERLYMTDLRAGSIVAQLTVRPAAAVHGFEEAVGKETSASIAAQIKQSVAKPELSSQICSLVGPSLNDCSVHVVSSSVATPIVQIVQPPRESACEDCHEHHGSASSSEDGIMDHIGIIVGGSVGALLLCVGFIALIRCRTRTPKNQCADSKLSDAEKANTNLAVVEEGKVNMGYPEVQKDVEKDGQSDDASTVTPVEQQCEGTANVLEDADSGDGSQGPTVG